MGIREIIRRSLAKLVMRSAGDQAKMACENLKLCAGLEAGIEAATHSVVQHRIDRVRARRRLDKEAEASDVEGNSGGVVAGLNNLIIETAITEEEAVDIFVVVQEMEVEEEG